MKLTLASFFHDLPLKNDELAAFQSLADVTLNAERFTPAESDAFARHSEDGANLLMQIKEIPPEVHQIVLQHHERPDGTGFPKGLDFQKIDPLSAVFIVAHELYRHYRLHGVRRDLSLFVEELGPFFRKGSFGQIITAMVKTDAK